MKHFEEENEFDKRLKSMNNKFRISAKEQKYVLNEINRNIDRNVPTQSRKSSQWKYYIASVASVFILILLAIPLFSNTYENLTGSDELSGKTLEVAYIPGPFEDIDDPSNYDRIMTLSFSHNNVVTNTINDEEGTYEFDDDELVLHFENRNENLEIKFTVEESDKDFSEYSALISDTNFEIKDTEKISHFKNLTLRLTKNMPIEFLKK